MFSLFPQILFLGPAGIGLLRIVGGIYLIYIGYSLWSERGAVAQERFPIIGHIPEWLSMIAAALQTALGILLIVGAWTQLAALLASIVALKCIVYARRYKKIIPLDRAASILLLAIFLALVVMGPGALAFDLPL
ncbi:MAG TPA: DoxX family membrane protein [Candidatus Paceibacterota bacterium]